jgi:hypothetical protein
VRERTPLRNWEARLELRPRGFFFAELRGEALRPTGVRERLGQVGDSTLDLLDASFLVVAVRCEERGRVHDPLLEGLDEALDSLRALKAPLQGVDDGARCAALGDGKVVRTDRGTAGMVGDAPATRVRGPVLDAPADD